MRRFFAAAAAWLAYNADASWADGGVSDQCSRPVGQHVDATTAEAPPLGPIVWSFAPPKFGPLPAPSEATIRDIETSLVGDADFVALARNRNQT